MAIVVDVDALPNRFPTHLHEPAFWESLGRAVATFGFLEEILGKAIFALTATRQYDAAEMEDAYAKWLPQLERALIDPLGNLIDAYGNAARAHENAAINGLDELISDLRNASAIRNLLCHASWQAPDASGASKPLFVNRQRMVAETAVDVTFLEAVQQHTAMLATAVMNSVTAMGWQFPGSSGPGKPIWKREPSG